MPYDFETQLKLAKEAEIVLDRFFTSFFEWEHTPLVVDKIGIDRYFIGKGTGLHYGFEYKADTRATSSKNAFVEYVSNDKTGKRGWIYTCLSNYLVYYLPLDMRGWIMDTLTLKNRYKFEWAPKAEAKEYLVKGIPNNGYKSWGVCVPLSDFTSRGVWGHEFSTAEVVAEMDKEMKNGRSESTDSTTK